MLGSAFVTTRLSSTTMKSAVETIANVHPVLVRDFIGASPSLVVSVRLLTLITKKRGQDSSAGMKRSAHLGSAENRSQAAATVISIPVAKKARSLSPPTPDSRSTNV